MKDLLQLSKTSFTDKDKGIIEIEEGLGHIATPRKHGVAKKQYDIGQKIQKFSSCQRKQCFQKTEKN